MNVHDPTDPSPIPDAAAPPNAIPWGRFFSCPEHSNCFHLDFHVLVERINCMRRTIPLATVSAAFEIANSYPYTVFGLTAVDGRVSTLTPFAVATTDIALTVSAYDFLEILLGRTPLREVLPAETLVRNMLPLSVLSWILTPTAEDSLYPWCRLGEDAALEAVGQAQQGD